MFIIDFLCGCFSFCYNFIILSKFGGFINFLRFFIGFFYYLIFFFCLLCIFFFKYVDIILKIKFDDKKYMRNELISELIFKYKDYLKK
jgi:hypothetical protein